MNEISHDQADLMLLAAEDGLLDETQHAELRHHLRKCELCRKKSEDLEDLNRDLHIIFQERWDSVKAPKPLLVEGLPEVEAFWPRIARMAVNIFIVVLWIWLYRDVFDYFKIIFTKEEFRTNQIILVIVLVLLINQFRKERWQLRFDVQPQIFGPGLFLLIIGSGLLHLAYLDYGCLRGGGWLDYQQPCY